MKTHLYDWKPETTLTILKLIKDEKELDQNEISNLIKKLNVFYSIIKYLHTINKFIISYLKKD